MAGTKPGEMVEMDFGRLGLVTDLQSGRRRLVWALVIVLGHSRHSFVWPLMRQQLGEIIKGMVAAWAFFGGVPHNLVLDYIPRQLIRYQYPWRTAEVRDEMDVRDGPVRQRLWQSGFGMV